MTQGRKPAGAARAVPPPGLRPIRDTDPDQTATDETTKVGPMTALIAEMMLQEEEVDDPTPQVQARDDAAALRAARNVHVSPSSHPPNALRSYPPPRFPSNPPVPTFGSRPPPAYTAPAIREAMPTPPRTVPVSSFPPAASLTTDEELYLMRRRRAPIFIVVGAVLFIGGGIALALTLLQ